MLGGRRFRDKQRALMAAGMVPIAPWLVLAGYGVVVWVMMPKRVDATQFFEGGARSDAAPGFWLLVASAAITWVFAKSISNAANLSNASGLWGGIGYTVYYLSFVVVGLAVFVMRTRGGHTSLAALASCPLRARRTSAALAPRNTPSAHAPKASSPSTTRIRRPDRS